MACFDRTSGSEDRGMSLGARRSRSELRKKGRSYNARATVPSHTSPTPEGVEPRRRCIRANGVRSPLHTRTIECPTGTRVRLRPWAWPLSGPPGGLAPEVERTLGVIAERPSIAGVVLVHDLRIGDVPLLAPRSEVARAAHSCSVCRSVGHVLRPDTSAASLLRRRPRACVGRKSKIH